MTRWVTVKKASDETGLPPTYFDERTGPGAAWPEGKVYKWFEGRKLIDLDALNALIDRTPSIHSNRGRTRAKKSCDEQEIQLA